MHAARKLAAALAGLAAAALVQAQGTDDLWSMTTSMEMQGMKMPGRSQQVCTPKGETRGEDFSQDKNCKVTEQHRDGNKFTWKVVCSGDEAMTGTGEMTRNRDTMSGQMVMRNKDGETIKIAYSGKRTGTCNAQTHEDPQTAAAKKQMAAMQAQGAAATAQMCSDAIEKYSTPMFEMQNSPCAAQKGEYCAQVKKTAQSMRSPAGYRGAMQKQGMARGGWEQAAKYCGVPTAPVQAAACKSAVGSQDWSFVADFCPAESDKIAAEQCAGREYTVAMSSAYKAICAKHADSLARGSREAAKPAAPSAAESVKEGARGVLKGLFGR